MAAEQLIDTYGRVHRDLRISVTDRCNFRCTYCMPEEGMQWLAKDEILTFEETARLARIFVERFGFDCIRLTGGEPTVRAHLQVLIEQISGLRVGGDGPLVDIAMTTNASTLRNQAHDLVDAGLRRINVSLDSLRPDRFHEMTRRDELPKVLGGIDAAKEAGLDPVKVNVVLIGGVNDDEVVDFARWGRDQGTVVRFIEYMPLDADATWQHAQVVPQAEIVRRIEEVFPLEPVVRGNEPAERFRYLDLPDDHPGGVVGVIPSVTRPFCDSCDRVRLTAEGQLRNCLFALDEFDLRGPLRSGASDDDLAEIMHRAVGEKWAGHAIGQVQFIRPRKSMSQIGG
ncbi:MAG: GTP 3',8-cyclase MoaA [Acidimicrobiales bacterium]|nr:GTP 3',8-cyclase MoaA [Acidimicrobiales bacterium]